MVYRACVYADCGPGGFDTMVVLDRLHSSIDTAKAAANEFAGRPLEWKLENGGSRAWVNNGQWASTHSVTVHD